MSKDSPNTPQVTAQPLVPTTADEKTQLLVVQVEKPGKSPPHPHRNGIPEISTSVPPQELVTPEQGDKDHTDDLEANLYKAPITQWTRRHWPLDIFPNASEYLRDYPEFDLDSSTLNSSLPATIQPANAAAHSIWEADREELFRFELLRMFRQRLHLASSLGMLIVPLFAGLFLYLSASAWKSIIPTHGALYAICLAVRFLAPRAPSLLWVRLLSLIAYAMICMGVALIVAQESSDPALSMNPLAAYAGYNYIMLSLLLLPYSVWENLVIVLIATSTLVWSIWLTTGIAHNDLFISQLLTLTVTALFVICIAHLQGVLRRKAFDATFDLAYNAAHLQALSTSDQLTGGHNRRHLEKILSHEIARAARFMHPLSVIMFDLDNFKQVNDTLGHRAGDEVLREVWQSAVDTVREIDEVARYGGDEFTIVLPETDEKDAYIVAERLLHTTNERLQNRFGASCPKGQVTLSIGLVTHYLTNAVPVEALLEQADQRLYEAKRAGKNCIAMTVIAP